MAVISIATICTAKGQNQDDHVVNDTVYYKLVADAISQDTIVPEWRSRIIGYKVQKGLLTKADSTKYYNIINNRKLQLYYQKTNINAKRAFFKDLEGNGFLEKYLTREQVQNIIRGMPKVNGLHNISLISNEIEVIEEFPKWEIYHTFSAPVFVDENRFLVYYFRGGEGPTSYRYGFFLFSLVDNEKGYEIEKNIILHLH